MGKDSRVSEWPQRRRLPHDIPSYIDPGAEVYFITINCRKRGMNQLCMAGVGEALLESARFRQKAGHWHAHLVVLMPDHLHGLFSFPQTGPGMRRTIQSWKSLTAKTCGLEWQRDFFEHRLRGDESRAEKSAYIRANPVRAGLVEEAKLWPWIVESECW
ncbi:MAG: hypothetical protein ABIT76_03560 [Chthoniobacterales bacterium]